MSRRRKSGPIAHNSNGTVSLVLEVHEREILATFLAQFRELVIGDRDDARLARLFPNAYNTDAEKNEEYRRFMDDELVASRTAMIDRVAELLAEDGELTDADLGSVMVTVNGLRLVLGTILGIDHDEWEPDFDEDDPEDPAAGQWQLYMWLGWLLEWIIESRETG